MPKNEVKKLKEEIERLKGLIARDELTGLLNRKGIKEEFIDLFKEILYYIKHPKIKRKIHINDFSIIFIDIDNFKKINDTFGHDAGDIILENVADILRKKTRGIDAVGRLGGEEFVIALVGASEAESLEKAEEIRQYVKQNVRLPRRKNLKMTLSAGVASIRESKAKDVMDLISMADKAMYEAKHNRGKDNSVKYSEIA